MQALLSALQLPQLGCLYASAEGGHITGRRVR
jgi:hypothetical protein